MKVHPRVAMELARHSDMRLTMKTYTDVGQLPLREVMDSLPGFGSDSRIDSRNLGPTGQTVSQPVTETREMKIENTIANKGESHDLTAAVPVCHSEPESGGFGIRIPLSPPVCFKSIESIVKRIFAKCKYCQLYVKCKRAVTIVHYGSTVNCDLRIRFDLRFR
jgi:hypothetical protein